MSSDPALSDDRLRVEKRTFRLDSLRASMSGIAESGWQTFGLILITRYFEGEPYQKSLVATAVMLGMLLNPQTNFLFAKTRLPATKLSACIYGINALLFLAAGMSQSVEWFITFGVMAAALFAQALPLTLHVYATNYRNSRRGRLVSVGMSLGIVTSIPFAAFGGRLLDKDLSQYSTLFGIMAAASAIAGILSWRVPSTPIQQPKSCNPIANLSIAWKNKVFGAMLIMWMVLGFGNLSTFHLRVEYMSAEKYGILASNQTIAICTMVIPAIMTVISVPIWGHAFDRYNFFAVRAAANISIALGIIFFFFADTLPMLYLGSAIFGISLAGAKVNWNLWVTRFAPPGEEAEYMSVHTFLTGTRGVAAPFMGFYLIQFLTIQQAAIMSLVLIISATISIWPISRMDK